MSRLRKALQASVLLLVVFSSLFMSSNTYAYWASNVTGDNDLAPASVTTGTWTQAFQYDPNTSYNIGDIVTNNGVTYEAKKSGLLREPGVDGGWSRDWTQL